MTALFRRLLHPRRLPLGQLSSVWLARWATRAAREGHRG